MIHFSLFNAAPRFNHLKPAKLLYGLVGAFDGLVHCVLNGGAGRAGEFYELIDGVFHVSLSIC